jgi:solute carrier family 26 (sodium-independent sulfate anion transporter), member 11
LIAKGNEPMNNDVIIFFFGGNRILSNLIVVSFAASGVIVDASQEMIALGLCNIFGACVKSMPTCGAFTRSAVSHASGVRTPMAGIYAGGMTLLALSLLTPYFYFIPRTTLAAVLICAVAFMIDLGLPKRLWLSNKRDFIAWLACFVVCMVFGVEVGLLFGIFINIVHLLFIWARPDIQVKLEDVDSMQYISVTPNLGLYYPGVDHLREKVGKAILAAEFQVPVVIFCGKISGLDYSSAKVSLCAVHK